MSASVCERVSPKRRFRTEKTRSAGAELGESAKMMRAALDQVGKFLPPGRRFGYLGVLRAARGLRLRDQKRRLCPQSPLATTQCLRSPPRGWRRLAFELGGTEEHLGVDSAIWESCARCHVFKKKAPRCHVFRVVSGFKGENKPKVKSQIRTTFGRS